MKQCCKDDIKLANFIHQIIREFGRFTAKMNKFRCLIQQEIYQTIEVNSSAENKQTLDVQKKNTEIKQNKKEEEEKIITFKAIS